MAFRELNSFFNIMNTRISFSEIGDGNTYLALHGNPGSRKDFSGITKDFKNENCRLIIPDRPGHNSSEELLSAQPDSYLDTKAYAGLIDKLCDGKTWLIGYSFGAYAACKIAAKYPEKVSGIIMFSPYIVPEKETVSGLPKYLKNPLLGTILGIIKPLMAQKVARERIEKQFFPIIPDEDYIQTWLPRYTRFETILAETLDYNWMLETHKEVFEKLKTLDIPVKALFGGEDKLMNIELQKNALVECFTKAEIVVLEKAGHALPNNNFDECLKLLDN